MPNPESLFLTKEPIPNQIITSNQKEIAEIVARTKTGDVVEIILSEVKKNELIARRYSPGILVGCVETNSEEGINIWNTDNNFLRALKKEGPKTFQASDICALKFIPAEDYIRFATAPTCPWLHRENFPLEYGELLMTEIKGTMFTFQLDSLFDGVASGLTLKKPYQRVSGSVGFLQKLT